MNNNRLSVKLACLMAIEAVYLSSPYSMASAAALEEVLVSARKKEEILQETPLSIMAFGAQELAKINVSDFLDLNTKLPNVNLTAAGGAGSNNASFTIRGLGSGTQSACISMMPITEKLTALF